MKNIFKTSILALIALLVFACESDDDKAVAQAILGPEIETPNTSVILDKNLEDNPAVTIVWRHGDYDVETQINYLVEIALVNTDFGNPITITTTTDRFYTFTVKELNSKVLEAGMVADLEGSVEIRVKSSIGSENVDEKTSESTILTTTPYSTNVIVNPALPSLWLPGNYAEASGYGANWAPADSQTPRLMAENETSTKFEGFVYFAEANSEFKMTEGPDWDAFTNYGITGGVEGTLHDGDGEDNIPVAAAGYYKIDADTDALTYTLTPTSWAVTGNATPNGWPSDTVGDHDMTYDPVAKVWTITLDLTQQDAPDNGIKFRANDDWPINIGDNDADGTMEFNGQNMGVPEDGNYTITLDLSNPRAYTYSLVKN